MTTSALLVFKTAGMNVMGQIHPSASATQEHHPDVPTKRIEHNGMPSRVAVLRPSRASGSR